MKVDSSLKKLYGNFSFWATNLDPSAKHFCWPDKDSFMHSYNFWLHNTCRSTGTGTGATAVRMSKSTMFNGIWDTSNSCCALPSWYEFQHNIFFKFTIFLFLKLYENFSFNPLQPSHLYSTCSGRGVWYLLSYLCCRMLKN